MPTTAINAGRHHVDRDRPSPLDRRPATMRPGVREHTMLPLAVLRYRYAFI